jgi:hypothetical protein
MSEERPTFSGIGEENVRRWCDERAYYIEYGEYIMVPVKEKMREREER